MGKKREALYDPLKLTKESELINGLIAIGNAGEQQSAQLDTLNDSLANSHFNLRKNCIRQNKTQEYYDSRAKSLLEQHAADFQQACEDANLMNTNLSTQWRTKAKGADKDVTAQQLFDQISKFTTTRAANTQDENHPNAPEMT